MVRRWKDTHVLSDSIAMAATISPVRLSAIYKAHKKEKGSKNFANLNFPIGHKGAVTSNAAAPNSAAIMYGISLVGQELLTAILFNCNEMNNVLFY